jgi:hypothetical protein
MTAIAKLLRFLLFLWILSAATFSQLRAGPFDDVFIKFTAGRLKVRALMSHLSGTW